MNRLTQGVRGRGGSSKSPVTASEFLSLYRSLLELREFPAEKERPKLAAYIAGLPGRLARLPRVEAIPRKGQSEEVETNLPFPAMDTFPRPIRVETQFLNHDVEKYARLNEKVLVLLKQPTSSYNEQDSISMCDWLLYELRYACGCTMRWKSPPKIAVAPNSGHQPAQLWPCASNS